VTNRPGTHECEAFGCGRLIHARFLFCLRHWAMVPWDTRRMLRTHGKDRESTLYRYSLLRARADIADEEVMRFAPSTEEEIRYDKAARTIGVEAERLLECIVRGEA